MEPSLLFACVQDALKGRPVPASIISEARGTIRSLVAHPQDAHAIETALMYPALLQLDFYRGVLTVALAAIHRKETKQ